MALFVLDRYVALNPPKTNINITKMCDNKDIGKMITKPPKKPVIMFPNIIAITG